MDKEFLIKSCDARLEQKAEGEDGKLHIQFYGAAFGNVDSRGDIIDAKAFDAFLASDAKERVRLCYQHDTREVIGVITDMKVDSYGLLCEADILPTTSGKDVQTLIQGGAITEFSIGYYADEYHFEKRDGYNEELRILDAISLVEISPVTRAANPKAILLNAKSDDYLSAVKQMKDAELESLMGIVTDEYYSRFFGYIN